MSTLPPFGDIVVVASGGSLDGFKWDEMQMKVIYEHREYHSAIIHFLDDLAYNAPAVICLEDQKATYLHY